MSESDMAENLFVYSPLATERMIRLIKFQESSAGKINCEIIHVETDKCPRYIALSYTWGDPGVFDYIYVSGKALGVPMNLAQPLAWFSHFEPEYHFWADSICINQKDLAERSSQVQLMTSIYKGADWVAAWLGPSTPATDFAFEKIREWDKYYESLSEIHGENVYSVLEEIFNPSNEKICGPIGSEAHKAWWAIHELCQRDWWSRAWVMQEATTPRALTIHCGINRFVTFSRFRAVNLIAHCLCKNTGLSEIPGAEIVRHFDRGETFQLDTLQLARLQNSSPTFLQVLQLFRRCQCTDHRDRVFAALGILSDAAKVDIVSDYEQTVDDIYTDVVKYVLHCYPEGHRLDFLGYVLRSIPSGDSTKNMERNNSDLPTWVPDWRECMVGDVVPNIFHTPYEINEEKSNNAIGETDQSKDRTLTEYNASGESPTHARILGRVLVAKGVLIDTVGQVSLVEDKPNTFIPEIFVPCKHPYPTGESGEEALRETVVAETLRATSSLYSRRVWDTNVERGDKDTTIHQSRGFFWTGRGYVGVGSCNTQAGDSVVLLFGGQVPYILRDKEDDEFEFIGECYIHGLMFGEGLQYGYDDGGIETNRDFKIV
jgi:hypothetical protein